MNICYTLDKNYLPRAKTMLRSMMQCNAPSDVGEDCTVFLVSEDDLTLTEEWAGINQMAKAYGWGLQFCAMNFGGYVPKFVNSRSWARPAFYRLWLHLTLPDSVGKVLYLDLDILTLGRVDDLWRMDMTGVAQVAALDKTPEIVERFGTIFKGMEHEGKNLHSGVMLINLDFWRQNAMAIAKLYYDDDHDEKLKASTDGLTIRNRPDWYFDTYTTNVLAEMFPYKIIPQRYNFHSLYYESIEGIGGERQRSTYFPNIEAWAYIEQVLDEELAEEFKNVRLLHYEVGIKLWDLPQGRYEALSRMEP